MCRARWQLLICLPLRVSCARVPSECGRLGFAGEWAWRMSVSCPPAPCARAWPCPITVQHAVTSHACCEAPLVMMWIERRRVGVSMWLLLAPEIQELCSAPRRQLELQCLVGVNPTVCCLASPQSRVARRTENSSSCSRCTSRRCFSSFGQRGRCRHWLGTGRRRCFPEGRS